MINRTTILNKITRKASDLFHSLLLEKNLEKAPLLAFVVEAAGRTPSRLTFKLSLVEDFVTLLPLFRMNLSGIRLFALMEKARFFLISLAFSACVYGSAASTTL